MPIVATATLTGSVARSEADNGVELQGDVFAAPGAGATFQAAVSRQTIESLTGPSITYGWAVRLAGEWIPAHDLLGPFEIDESIDTIATLFSFTLVGRRWSIEITATTWTSTPVELWVTAGPAGNTKTWRRAFGYVITCQPSGEMEPTVKVQCGDPSRLYDRQELCYELPVGAGLTRGEICAEILSSLELESDIPGGAVYLKPIITDSQKLWGFLGAFGEPEGWSWRFTDWAAVEAVATGLREHPEPPDDVWTLRDVVSIESAPPADVPSRWIVRSTQISEDDEGGIKITRQRTEAFEFYAVRKAVAQQLGDGSQLPVPGASPEIFQIVSAVEEESHEQAGLTVAKIIRQWGWYNPRAAKLRTSSAGEPPGPVEDGYYWAQAWVTEDGSFVAWPREQFIQTGERRELPSYDADGTEVGRRIETYRWHGKAMGTRSVGSAVPNVVGAGVGDDDRSWFAFERALTNLLRIEDFGLAQVDELSTEYGEQGAAAREVAETFTWYAPRTAVSGVPWFVNYSGAGQRDLVAPWQKTTRKLTVNNLTTDGLLAGTFETVNGWVAPRRVDGAFDWGDGKSNLQQEKWGITGLKTTLYNVLDETSYEELTDDGTGASSRIVMGRAPRPRYRQSTWTTLVQRPIEVLLEDPVAAAWWGPADEVLTLEYTQTLDEALAVARRRRSRRMAHVYTVIRPVCPIRPGATVLLVDPRSGIESRCLVTRCSERWSFAPKPQILATYILERPL
jgi:hypothetical protein